MRLTKHAWARAFAIAFSVCIRDMAWCPAAGGFCVAIGVAAAELPALRQDLQQAQSLAIVVNKPSQGGGGGYAKALALSNLIGSENECLYRLRSSQLRACGSSASDYSQAKIKEGNVFPEADEEGLDVPGSWPC